MDPITLAVATSAVTLLAKEAGKGIASEAGKSLWAKIAGLFKWQPSAPPPDKDLAVSAATAMFKDPKLTKDVIELLQAHSNTASPVAASMLVGTINATNVINAQHMPNATFTFTNTTSKDSKDP